MFASILNQMIFMFAFIIIGFILSKWKFLPDNSATVLSKLENFVLVPALVLGTFIKNCNLSVLSSMWKILLLGFALVALFIAVSLLLAKVCFKEKYLQKNRHLRTCVFQFWLYGQRRDERGVPRDFFRVHDFHIAVLVYDLPLGRARAVDCG